VKKCVIIVSTIVSVFFLCGISSAQINQNKFAPSKPQIQKLKFTVSDSWISRDKVHHFLTSAFLTTSGYYYSREVRKYSIVPSRQIAVSFSVSLGLLKEIRDGVRPGNAFSWKDLAADVLGTAAGIIIIRE